MQKKIEETVGELTMEESHVSALKAQIAKLQRDLADHEARAEAKTRTLATSMDELEAIVRDYSVANQFDYMAEERRLR